jgi:predicted RNA-binding Zn-ribbon protein involved in translation (DUF1610 family)
MGFQLDCPACRKAITITPELVGKLMACPHCACHFSLPAEGEKPSIIRPSNTPVRPSAAMVKFTFSCTRCGSILEARGEQCGQLGRCPTCGGVFTVPAVDPHTGLAGGPAAVADDGQLPTPMHAYATAGTKAPKIKRLESGEQVILCPRCGRDMPVDVNTCRSCGMPFTMEGAAQIMEAGPITNNLAPIALTLGILSLPTFCLPILGPAAVIAGWLALRRARVLGPIGAGRSMAIAGMICGILSVVVFAARLVLGF